MPNNKIQSLFSKIKQIPNFPKSGINFFDLNPVFANPADFQILIEALAEPLKNLALDKIIGVESRGFILGAALAQHLKIGFVPLRKPGKLPPPVIRKSYSLEYGKDALEIQPGSGRVALIDDVLATGGTLLAAASLSEEAGYQIESIQVVLNLKDLNSFSWKKQKAQSLFEV